MLDGCRARRSPLYRFTLLLALACLWVHAQKAQGQAKTGGQEVRAERIDPAVRARAVTARSISSPSTKRPTRGAYAQTFIGKAGTGPLPDKKRKNWWRTAGKTRRRSAPKSVRS